MIEELFQMILKQYNSNFINNEISPGIYSNKDISEAVYTKGERELQIIYNEYEYNDISMKIKIILSPFVNLRFNEKSFFK